MIGASYQSISSIFCNGNAFVKLGLGCAAAQGIVHIVGRRVIAPLACGGDDQFKRNVARLDNVLAVAALTSLLSWLHPVVGSSCATCVGMLMLARLWDSGPKSFGNSGLNYVVFPAAKLIALSTTTVWLLEKTFFSLHMLRRVRWMSVDLGLAMGTISFICFSIDLKTELAQGVYG